MPLAVEALPDVVGIRSVPPETWRSLRTRLRGIGLTLESARQITRVGSTLWEPLRASIRVWHLRRCADPVAYAMRLLMFFDPVTRDEAVEALGDRLIDSLLAVGFLQTRSDDLLTSPFTLNIVEELYMFCDDVRIGGYAVMGATRTTSVLCQAGYPVQPVGSVLDVGCGAGTAALVYAAAGRARRAIGVDVNPRALALARVNAAVNGVANVEFRLGDLFSSVENERFDLIVSNPPYIARPASVSPTLFLHGGSRGDELPVRLLGGLSARLSPGGRAVVLVEWPLTSDESLERRLRAALGSNDLSLLLIRFPPSDVDEYAAVYAAMAKSQLADDFEQHVAEFRNHMEREGIRSLRLTIAVIADTTSVGGGKCWTSTVDIPAESTNVVTSARIEGLIAARNILAGAEATLLSVNLEVPHGTVISQQQSFSGLGTARLCLHFRDAALAYPVELNSKALLLIKLVHEARTVGEGLEAFLAQIQQVGHGARSAALGVVRDALLRGLLEPA
jgi:SAM-dependent methyltransferase